ncbi:ABC transporter substrate-binding protein [Planomonospora algeriensis]
MGGVAAGIALGWPVLGACGSPPTGAVRPAESGGTAAPRRGGTVRLAFTGGGATETLDPLSAYSPADLVRTLVVFDRLFTVTGGAVAPSLAVGAEPEADGRSFTLTLREGVTWHDGSPLSARDVLYSLRYLASPDRSYPSELLTYLDVRKTEVTGALTLRVPTLRPVGDPAALFAGASTAVIKDGTTSFAPGEVIGTGAYRVAAFAAGREARLVRNDDYWGGTPYADELVVISMDDAQARVNAVRGRQADYASDVPYTLAKTGAGDDGLEIRSAGEHRRTGYGFVLNTTRKLMADARVRRALRLGVDRQALVRTVFLDHGAVGNDLFGHGAPSFAEDIPVLARDVTRARELLEEAGATGASLVIRSAEYEAGLNASTELFAEQLRELGLKATVRIVTPVEYFDLEGLAAADAIAFPLAPFPLSVIFARSAAYPALAFKDPELEKDLATALSATGAREREAAWLRVQRVMADRGNWIVWGRGDVLSLARRELTGVEVRESAKYPYLGKAGFTG